MIRISLILAHFFDLNSTISFGAGWRLSVAHDWDNFPKSRRLPKAKSNSVQGTGEAKK
jgi:hypothetical protein